MRKWLELIDAALTFLERTTVALLLLVAVVILVADVALRAFFGLALAWAAELTRDAIVWLVFIGGATGRLSEAQFSRSGAPFRGYRSG